MTTTDLNGTTCIVTGGGRGLGRSMVHALAGAGANVTAAMHIADDIESETKDLDGNVKAMVADIRDPAACTQIVAETVSEFGGVDMLVNNAGVGMLLVSDTFNRTPTKFWDVKADIWAQIIETNVNGGFQMAREAVPHMLEKGWGRVVNVTTSIHTMQRRVFTLRTVEGGDGSDDELLVGRSRRHRRDLQHPDPGRCRRYQPTARQPRRRGPVRRRRHAG